MIESAAGSKVNFDDEDPDMSDWSDNGEQEGGPGGLEDDQSFDDDDFLDFVSDSDGNSNASTENENDTSNVFVNAEEYESRYSKNHDDSKHFSRKKRRKT